MIEINNLRKKIGKKEILKEISLHLEPCTYGLVGPNGAGKTTLLRILAGVMKADGGEIYMPKENGLTGYLPQKFGCFPEFTVYEQLEYFACLKEIPKAGQKEEIMRVLEIVNMDGQEKMKCKKLSGGMVRRIGIAQALLGDPLLLLLDEPTVGLDPEERNNFNNIIRKLEKKTTILLSTHLVEDIKYLCQEVIVVESGKILMVKTAKDISLLAAGRVYQVPETELENLTGPFYVENYYVQDGKKLAKVLMLGAVTDTEKYDSFEADIEDGYLLILKQKDIQL